MSVGDSDRDGVGVVIRGIVCAGNGGINRISRGGTGAGSGHIIERGIAPYRPGWSWRRAELIRDFIGVGSRTAHHPAARRIPIGWLKPDGIRGVIGARDADGVRCRCIALVCGHLGKINVRGGADTALLRDRCGDRKGKSGSNGIAAGSRWKEESGIEGDKRGCRGIAVLVGSGNSGGLWGSDSGEYGQRSGHWRQVQQV